MTWMTKTKLLQERQRALHLTPKEEDRLLVFLAAELARKRRARGLLLTYPEARALIADEVLEAARAGASVPEAAERGASVLTDDDILPGVASLIGTVQVEGFFDDGQKLVTIHDPIRPGVPRTSDRETGDHETGVEPGEVIVADGTIALNVDRPQNVLTVVNTGDRPIQVGSHFHFYEVNRALQFDRVRGFGMRLDIPAGTAVRFHASQERQVKITAIGGTRDLYGLNEMTKGSVSTGPDEATVQRLRDSGFRDTGTTAEGNQA
jgi:urease subunit gamma/beta